MKRKTSSLLLLIALLYSLAGYAQNGQSADAPKTGKTVRGKVVDELGETVPGVSILIQKSTRGVTTDLDGSYSIDNMNTGDVLEFSFLGYQTVFETVGDRSQIDVVLQPKSNELDEVAVVAFGKQKKESVISSIQTIKPGELKVPSSNLTTAFAGRIAGMISYQTSGEPGQDNADFFIRGVTTFGTGKVDPLLLIDNVEVTKDDLARMHPDDIASFSILKDATATALYGARGANGVILITTKEGKEGKTKVSVRIENSFSSPTTKIQMANPITYMQLANEAAQTRDPLAALPYSQEKIENTMKGTNPYVYPAVDWMDMLTKSMAVNQRANINISGGGTVARYYIAGSFSQDNGILNVDKRNNFNNNIDLKKYLIRSNININLTPTTEAIVRVHGTFDDYNGPIPQGNELYKRMLRVSPTRFPAYYEPDATYSHAQHILFGGYGGSQYLNPYAEMVKGYRQESKTAMLAQFELKQDFSKLLDGLTGRILGNTIRNSSFNLSRAYNPYYYEVSNYDRLTDRYLLKELNTTEGTEFLIYTPGDRAVSNIFYSEASLAYNQNFGKHGVSGMLVGIARNSLAQNQDVNTLAKSLQKRNLGISGRFTYAYDNRYLSEFNFGYNGSEKFDVNHRWGFFPSFGLGWNISNEDFWKSAKINNVIHKLKVRGTYGLVGNDEIGSERFFYLSQVSMGEESSGNNFVTGYDFDINKKGASIKNYSNSEIGWEIAYKTNLGIEMGMFAGKLDIIADLFKEHRVNILQPRADVPVSMGLWSTPLVNVGEARGKGIDVSVDYNQFISNDFWITARGNFTYARSTFSYYEEPDYTETPWKSRVGYPVSQKWGYVAERLFIDEEDIRNSPAQNFGEYRPGDIKYKNINGDDVINELDMVPIGYPTTPEINYGFGISTGYKGFDFSFFFQGSARSSFWINSKAMSPFRTEILDEKILETGLAQFIADDYWSEASQNPYAQWPRLSNYLVQNNVQESSFYMQNGSFLRLKSVEFGYEFPRNWSKKLHLEQLRLYLNGTNLLCFSQFELWDVEMGGNGLNYPIQRIFNIGLNVSF